jgi:DNA-binding NtrC family response regulator
MRYSRVLLVDDEHEFTENMMALLESRGFHAQAADSGSEAIEVLMEEDFDVVVLDLKMPGMDGITTLEQIQELGLYCQVLVLTGHGSIDTAKEALKLGAFDYLTKPCEIDDLVDKIQAAWTRKDDEQRRDMDERIKRVIESPRDAHTLFNGRKRKT